MGLRVHRAISWIGRAEKDEADSDACFIFLWIAFNAAYADARTTWDTEQNERSAFSGFFTKLVELDRQGRIYGAIWERFSGPIRTLLANHFVFHPFWHHQNGLPGYENWKERFDVAHQHALKALAKRDTVRILGLVFDRLYVLRNQIVHGGATWSGGVNRQQVKDGASILRFLMPVFVDLMMDNPQQDWGIPYYPVVEA